MPISTFVAPPLAALFVSIPVLESMVEPGSKNAVVLARAEPLQLLIAILNGVSATGVVVVVPFTVLTLTAGSVTAWLAAPVVTVQVVSVIFPVKLTVPSYAFDTPGTSAAKPAATLTATTNTPARDLFKFITNPIKVNYI